ncbi:TonB-dependent receptor [Noviherbaspirillum sedimenti]|uniref:TonB-dependent receptor n=1 Tax=Noviherbaspirillum sedimenti TaxID=2320865 RepID=UPI001314289D|nr:TonB-dependent receptor [Noviherbaspirillum sedimenti]
MLGIWAPSAYAEQQELPTVTVQGSRVTSGVALDAEAGTATRLGVSVKDVPASVEILTQEAMRAQGSRTMVEAVEKAAGFSGGFTGGTPGTFSVRGFTNNGVAFLHNGVRIPGGTGMSSRNMDVANFDRIEVLRGPASVLYGEGAIGAAVNFISRTPSRKQAPFEASYAFSSFNSHRLHAGTGGPVKEGAAYYRIDASLNDYGSHVEDNRSRLERLTGSLLFTLAPSLDLTLEFDKMRDRQKNAYWGTPLVNGRIDPALRRVNYNNLNDDRFAADTTWLRANLSWTPNAQWEVRNQLYHYDSYRDWRNVENLTYNAGAAPTVTRFSWGDLDHDHQVTGNRTEALHKGSLGALENRLAIGMDVNATRFATARNGFPAAPQTVDAFNPAPGSFAAATPINRSPARRVGIDQWSIFAEDQLSLTSALKLVGGLRHDRFDVNWTYFDLAGAPSESKTYSANSYRAGLVYDVLPNLTLYASYATAVEPGGTLLLLNRNQSQLALSRAKQWEAGLKQGFWAGKGEWTLAIYDIVKTNVFVPDPVNPANRLPVGRQSSTGAEVSVSLRPTRQWTLDANLALVNARFDDFSEGSPPVSRNGNTPTFVPEAVANLGVRYAPDAQWEFGTWVRRVSTVHTDNANTVRLPAYTTLDLGATYKVSKRLEIGMRVRNATDALYAHWAYRPQQVMIAEPRTYEASVRASF